MENKMDRELFGDDCHYYSRPNVPERQIGEYWDTDIERRIRNLLTSQQADVKERVEHTCRQFNPIIRDHLRSETALRLSLGDRRQSVPYQVVDGIPISLARKLEELPDPILLILLQNRWLLKNGESALNLLQNHLHSIFRILDKEDSGEGEALRTSSFFIKEILDKLDTFKLQDMIKDINEDVLGAYFFRVPTIQIYWMPIAIVAGLLDVSVESLSFVVLTHELSHAYTHIGLDIDGGQWNTDKFANTSKMIVEGLAQFYTESVCRKHENRQPDVLTAFNKFLEKQSEPYTHFKNWPQEHAAEVVRFSMISTRSNNICHYDRFIDELNDNSKKIKQ
jgi:hypothetical protein